MAPRGAQEAPRRPQEAPRAPQEAPRRAQGGPRGGPRRSQDGPKSLPRRIQDETESRLIRAMLPRRPQESRRGPKWPPSGSKEPPRGPQESPSFTQERPRSLQEPPKRPPRGLQDPIFSFRMAISCERGRTFNASPLACNMSPLGRRRGPALRAESGGRPEGRRLARSVRSRRAWSCRFGHLSRARRLRAFRRASESWRFSAPNSASVRPSCPQDGSKNENVNKTSQYKLKFAWRKPQNKKNSKTLIKTMLLTAPGLPQDAFGMVPR